jgi:glutamate--cysteine ligase
MSDNFKFLQEILPLEEARSLSSLGKIGIEKESLRFLEHKISTTDHPKNLGSSLCNSYITTDFSEALMEFVTKPEEKICDSLLYLDDIQHFVYSRIENEFLWPLSMPPFFSSDKEIPIAKYGSSNLALFKMSYRSGLSHRYGKIMQTIAGIHFNYSLPEEIWKAFSLDFQDKDIKSIKNIIYFRMLRNIHRFNWMILYFFGASPIISSNFLGNDKKLFKKYNDSFYLPHATSLRMSDLGYQNLNQAQIDIPLTDIADYIHSLKKSTEIKFDDYQEIFENSNEQYPQLNSNILQIEDEYYAISRPKSSVDSEDRLASKILNNGVDYLELRSLDLNPFNSIGLDIETAKFLRIFLIYCAFSDSTLISDDEKNEIRSNELLVSREGRRPRLLLSRNGKKITLKDWSNSILDEMELFFEYFGEDIEILNNIRLQVEDSNLTLSARVLDDFIDQRLNYIDFGLRISEKYKNQYINRNMNNNSSFVELEKEVKESLMKQKIMEKNSNKSFEDYMKSYFKS